MEKIRIVVAVRILYNTYQSVSNTMIFYIQLSGIQLFIIAVRIYSPLGTLWLISY
jgi:hypothetical protein